MPVDPALKPFLGQPGPSLDVLDNPVAFREQVEQATAGIVDLAMEPAPSVASVDDVEIPVDEGQVRARIFCPHGDGPLPVHLFFHGGAFTLLSAYSPAWLNLAQDRAARAGHIVVSVDYRKSPEHKFPTALGDAYHALTWTAATIARYGGDPDRISVGGGSAGGNIAAALALKVRDEGGPRILFQLLEVPLLDLRADAPYDSRALYGRGYMLSDEELELARVSYLAHPQDALNPYASPLLAPDLSGLPPALVMAAQYDILSDDGVLYAQRLQGAGVPTRLSFQLGHTHSSSAFTKLSPAARAWRDEAVAALRTAASPSLPSTGPVP